MENKFAEISGIPTHYRQTGNGPVIILLHPSPRSSKMMIPLMNMLSEDFCVVAPDTPGYGFSAPLTGKPGSLYDYMPWLHTFVKQVTDHPVSIYGTATGAQLAIAYGLTHSENTHQLFLDNTAHFDEAQRREIVQQYFPDFSPQSDGSHLQKIWQYVCDSCLYFPWYDQKEENRIATQLPPESFLQEVVQDYILAGTGYEIAYRAAFEHERAEKIQQLTCPATIFKWKGSPLLKYIERLLQFPLPENIKVIETPANNNYRYEVMKYEIALSLKNNLSI
jgi:pimeloyl-ACP methyl ester carboxylesterase